MTRWKRRRIGLFVCALFCAASIGGIYGSVVTLAEGVSYHTTCVGHGFVEGASQTDGSFFSRVEAGCSSTYRDCELWYSSTAIGSQQAYGTTGTCSAYSRDFGDFTECHGNARVYDQGVFSYHEHDAPNWCG